MTRRTYVTWRRIMSGPKTGTWRQSVSLTTPWPARVVEFLAKWHSRDPV